MNVDGQGGQPRGRSQNDTRASGRSPSNPFARSWTRWEFCSLPGIHRRPLRTGDNTAYSILHSRQDAAGQGGDDVGDPLRRVQSRGTRQGDAVGRAHVDPTTDLVANFDGAPSRLSAVGTRQLALKGAGHRVLARRQGRRERGIRNLGLVLGDQHQGRTVGCLDHLGRGRHDATVVDRRRCLGRRWLDRLGIRSASRRAQSATLTPRTSSPRRRSVDERARLNWRRPGSRRPCEHAELGPELAEADVHAVDGGGTIRHLMALDSNPRRGRVNYSTRWAARSA